jgi:hypothetical protein
MVSDEEGMSGGPVPFFVLVVEDSFPPFRHPRWGRPSRRCEVSHLVCPDSCNWFNDIVLDLQCCAKEGKENQCTVPTAVKSAKQSSPRTVKAGFDAGLGLHVTQTVAVICHQAFCLSYSRMEICL